MAAPAPEAAAAFARPAWPPARPMTSHPQASTRHLKPMRLSTASAVYGTFGSAYWLRHADEDADRAENDILSRPPLSIDLRWNNRYQTKGLRATDEEYPTRAGACPRFVRPTDASMEADLLPAEDLYRYEHAEHVYRARESRALDRHFSFLSWNSGGERQALDQATFMTKSFGFGMLQETGRGDSELLEALGNVVVCGDRHVRGDRRVNLGLFGKSSLVRSASYLASIYDVTDKGTWRLSALFGAFVLHTDTPGDVSELRLGSAHLDHVHADGFDKARASCLELLTQAEELDIDIIGVDLTKAAHVHRKHPDEPSSFELAMLSHAHDTPDIPIALLSLAPDDCVGFIVPKHSVLFRDCSLNRHGWIPIHLPDVGVRLTDCTTHRPVFCFWAIDAQRSSKRGRDDRPSRAARQTAKKAKLLAKKEAKRGVR